MRILKKIFSLDRLIGMALVAGFIALYQWNPAPLEFARLKVFDYYQQFKPREIPPADRQPVTIVDLDEQSLETVGQWPWPRTTLAQLVQNLMQMGAGLVAFDIVFAEPDRLNPSSVADSLYGLTPEMKAQIEKLPSNDRVFAEVIKRSRVILGQAGRPSETEGIKGPPVKQSVAIRKLSSDARDPQSYLPSFPSLVRNVPVIEEAAAHQGGGHGIFSVIPDEDGIIRNVPAMFVHDGNYFPALSIEILRVATGRQTVLAETNVAGMNAIGITKGLKIQTDRNGRIWPHFSVHDPSKYVPAHEVLAGTADPAKIRGKLVMVGTSAVGLRDIRSIPTARDIPGVEVHAQLIEAMVSGQYLTRPNYANAVELAFLFFGGLIMVVLVPWVGARWTFMLFVLVAGGALGTSWYLYDQQRLLLDATYATAAVLLIYTALTYTGYAREEASRRQTRDAFSKYLSPDMVERVAANPGELKLGGEQREMTMLFCDVRGFTSISEQFDAVGLTRLINKLLTPLTKAILERRGTVDKYMGDCIMAFWNAPLDDADHARNGCLSAMAMLAEIEPLNERLEKEAEEEGRKHIPLKVGLGLNTGLAVVGNMGSEQRFDYSILGDSVNLAARLEGQSKSYGVNIVIGENTQAQVPELATVELDAIKVKGKSQAVTIYALLGDEHVAENQEFRTLKRIHQQMLDAYRAQQFETAMKKLKELRIICEPFGLDGLYDLYEERLDEYIANPPGAEWDGVYTATSK